MARMLFSESAFMKKHAGRVSHNRRRDVRLNIKTPGTSMKYKKDFLWGFDMEVEFIKESQ